MGTETDILKTLGGNELSFVLEELRKLNAEPHGRPISFEMLWGVPEPEGEIDNGISTVSPGGDSNSKQTLF